MFHAIKSSNPSEIPWIPMKIQWNPIKIPWNPTEIPWNPSEIPVKSHKKSPGLTRSLALGRLGGPWHLRPLWRWRWGDAHHGRGEREGCGRPQESWGQGKSGENLRKIWENVGKMLRKLGYLLGPFCDWSLSVFNEVSQNVTISCWEHVRNMLFKVTLWRWLIVILSTFGTMAYMTSKGHLQEPGSGLKPIEQLVWNHGIGLIFASPQKMVRGTERLWNH